MIRHQIDNFLSTLIGVTQLCILCFWKGSEINKITPFSPVSMTNMLVDFIKHGTPVNFLFHLRRPGQYQLFSQDLWQGGWKSGLYFWSFMMLPCLYKSACLLRKLSRYCQLHIKYWQKLVQIHEKSAIYCCHIVSPYSSSHLQLPFYFWKVYKVNKKFLFIKLSKSLKEKLSNIWEMYIISCIRYIFITSRDILSFRILWIRLQNFCKNISVI